MCQSSECIKILEYIRFSHKKKGLHRLEGLLKINVMTNISMKYHMAMIWDLKPKRWAHLLRIYTIFYQKDDHTHLLDEAASLPVLLAAQSLDCQLQVLGNHPSRLNIFMLESFMFEMLRVWHFSVLICCPPSQFCFANFSWEEIWHLLLAGGINRSMGCDNYI